MPEQECSSSALDQHTQEATKAAALVRFHRKAIRACQEGRYTHHEVPPEALKANHRRKDSSESHKLVGKPARTLHQHEADNVRAQPSGSGRACRGVMHMQERSAYSSYPPNKSIWQDGSNIEGPQHFVGYFQRQIYA